MPYQLFIRIYSSRNNNILPLSIYYMYIFNTICFKSKESDLQVTARYEVVQEAGA